MMKLNDETEYDDDENVSPQNNFGSNPLLR